MDGIILQTLEFRPDSDQLVNSMVMYPDKTESGIFFEKEKTFTNCRLCPVKKCPSRRAAYDSGLYERKYV